MSGRGGLFSCSPPFPPLPTYVHICWIGERTTGCHRYFFIRSHILRDSGAGSNIFLVRLNHQNALHSFKLIGKLASNFPLPQTLPFSQKGGLANFCDLKAVFATLLKAESAINVAQLSKWAKGRERMPSLLGSGGVHNILQVDWSSPKEGRKKLPA